jgi:peptidoglycan/xylan/chitin deacetylase (PgdA/CDA1 family)
VKYWHRQQLQWRSRGKLVLTYDDGPGPLLTSALVELLDRYHAKASFYLVGFRALRAPQSCDLLMERGHDLGCHTHMHRKPWLIPPWETARDAAQGYRSMSRWLKLNAAFRPPFGKLTTWSWLVAKRRGGAVSWWTMDGCDTHPTLPDPDMVAQRILDDGGAVVLLHSHDRGADRQDYVLALTERLLQGAHDRDMKTCTMSELLGDSTNSSQREVHGGET